MYEQDNFELNSFLTVLWRVSSNKNEMLLDLSIATDKAIIQFINFFTLGITATRFILCFDNIEIFDRRAVAWAIVQKCSVWRRMNIPMQYRRKPVL